MVASEQTLVTGAQLDTLCVNTIRTLAIDGVQQANSGHPGAPMGLAAVAYCLWQDFLRYDPADPTWLNSVLIPVATPGMMAATVTARKPAIKAYSTSSCPSVS